MLKISRDSFLFKTISYMTTVSFLSLVMNICYIHPAFADEAVAAVEKGEPAPFAGTLFNTEAAARILVELENSENECKLKIDKFVAENQALCQYRIDIKDSELKGCTQRLELITEIKDDQVNFLVERATIKKSESPALWLLVGITSGIAISFGSAWVWSEISHVN